MLLFGCFFYVIVKNKSTNIETYKEILTMMRENKVNIMSDMAPLVNERALSRSLFELRSLACAWN